MTHAPPVQVYDATPIQDEEQAGDKEEEISLWKRHQKILIPGLALVVVAGVTGGVLSNRANNVSDSLIQLIFSVFIFHLSQIDTSH